MPVNRRDLIEENFLTAITANTVSDVKNLGYYNNVTFYIVSSAVTTGADVLIETSHNGTDWRAAQSVSVSADGITEYSVQDFKRKFYRITIQNYVDGTYSVDCIGGN